MLKYMDNWILVQVKLCMYNNDKWQLNFVFCLKHVKSSYCFCLVESFAASEWLLLPQGQSYAVFVMCNDCNHQPMFTWGRTDALAGVCWRPWTLYNISVSSTLRKRESSL